MAAPTTITCKACGYARNEPERVYCHECGEKLERRHLPKKKDEAADQRRVQGLLHPRVPFFRPLLRGLAQTVGASAAVALAVLVFSAPSPPDPPTEEERADPPRLSIAIESALMSDQPHRISIDERSINTYFDAHIRSRDNSVLGLSLKFERAYIQLHPGACNICMVRRVGGVALYTRASYSLRITELGLDATLLGGGIGRVSLPPIAMLLFHQSFSQLWKALDTERKLLGRLASIEVAEGQIIMVSRPHSL